MIVFFLPENVFFYPKKALFIFDFQNLGGESGESSFLKLAKFRFLHVFFRILHVFSQILQILALGLFRIIINKHFLYYFLDMLLFFTTFGAEI